MIVDPDFLDHWKTRMLVNEMNDESAPLYVLRLWAHCQNRRQSCFDMPPEALKALCRFSGPANKLESSLSASGFIRRTGSQIEICNWVEYNSGLLANWANGKKGGRPPKKPPLDSGSDNRKETHGLPMDNPSLTHREPIGEEEIGLEKKKAAAAPKIQFQCQDGKVYSPTAEAIEAWKFALRNINVEDQLMRAMAKLMSEPPKPYGKVVGYVSTFLSNEDNKGPQKQSQQSEDRPEYRKFKPIRGQDAKT